MSLEGVEFRPARIKGTHPYSYRSGEWAEITGVKMTSNKFAPSRAVFECRYDDGKIDHIPVCDVDNYEISK